MEQTKKVEYRTTGKVGTNEHFPVDGTGRPAMVISGRTIPGRSEEYIWFRNGCFMADPKKKYRVLDDIDGEAVISQVAFMDAHRNNVANGGHAFRRAEPWMDKADAYQIFARQIADGSLRGEAAILAAAKKIESLPDGDRKPKASDMQVHVGVRDAAIRGVSLQEYEPDYGNAPAILSTMTPASPDTADTVRGAVLGADD